jgi:CelD/BcsL family acetyltransferase involved in cellulose biosynthesis
MPSTAAVRVRTEQFIVPGRKLAVRVLNSLDELEKLRPEWEELLSHYPQASIFSSWEWLSSWWRAFGKDKQLHVLAFEDADSRLAALAPLSLSTCKALGVRWKVMQLMGDGSHDSDNLDFPVMPGFEGQFVRGLVQHLETHAQLWDFCEFNAMPRNATAENHLLPLLREKGWAAALSHTPRRVIDLPETWEEYLRGLSANERRNIRRYRKLVESKHKVRVLRCASRAELATYLESLFALHQRTWQARGERGSFESPERRALYFELGSELLARRRLEFTLLELDGEVTAAMFEFRMGRTVYSLQQGFALDRPEERSGMVLRGYVLERLIAEGVRQYDFLGGKDPYKERWYPREDSYLNMRIARRHGRGNLFVRSGELAKTTKKWVRSHLPTSAWKVLHSVKTMGRGA